VRQPKSVSAIPSAVAAAECDRTSGRATPRRTRRPNFSLKLLRPGFGPPPTPPRAAPASRRHGSCKLLPPSRSLVAATAAPQRLRHVGPAAQLSVRSVSPAIAKIIVRSCGGNIFLDHFASQRTSPVLTRRVSSLRLLNFAIPSTLHK